MCGCESWTIKKAVHQRIDAFELWCWERLLRISWTARRSNQSILKEISPEYSLEGLILKLKLQSSVLWSPDVKKWLIWKDPDAGKDWRQEEKGMTEDEMVWWHHRLDGMSLSNHRELVMDREACCAVVHGVTRIRHNWAIGLNWMNAQSPLLCHSLNYRVCFIVLGAQWVHNMFMQYLGNPFSRVIPVFIEIFSLH